MEDHDKYLNPNFLTHLLKRPQIQQGVQVKPYIPQPSGSLEAREHHKIPNTYEQ